MKTQIFSIMVECKEKIIGKGFYKSYKVQAEDVGEAKKIVLSHDDLIGKEPRIEEIMELEMTSDENDSKRIGIIESTGRVYFDLND